MNNWLFVLGLAALAHISITFVVQISRILFGPGRSDAMIARVIAVLLGLAAGGLVVPPLLPIHAGTDILYDRLINSRDQPLALGLHLAGIAFIGYVGTYGLSQIGLVREGEGIRDSILVVVCLLSAFLLRILIDTLFRHMPDQPGFLGIQALPMVACSLGSLVALCISMPAAVLSCATGSFAKRTSRNMASGRLCAMKAGSDGGRAGLGQAHDAPGPVPGARTDLS